MHRDVIKILHEFTHSKYLVKIVERESYDRNFRYAYFFNEQGKEDSGLDCWNSSDFTVEDLNDIDSATDKIKSYIDKTISDRIRWAKEKEEKKKAINWTGRHFNRGDYVNFKGNEKYRAFEGTYVWTWFGHMSDFYIIEHPDGHDRKAWLTSRGFPDGFESVHSSQLKEGLKYIEVHCHPEFMGETDELVLIKPAEKQI